MNSSTLRRLAKDHAALYNSELPPHFLFPPTGSASSIPDDLTQLTILLTGPQGTPYSQGLWKLCLKIPEDYPKSPPKASFRTRIWHPNVEEHTGSVCVDTLKKDWEPKLTLRDVLVTISCLLIQPNPDSALNATAGHLLQDDYDSFSRQARLMTSIHASIPSDLKEAALAAKRRGEVPGDVTLKDTEQRPTLKGTSASRSSVVMKKPPQRIIGSQAAILPSQPAQTEEDSLSEDDEKAGSKENDPMLSPSPVPACIPRRPMMAKRPLSDLPIPTESDSDCQETSCTTCSEQNVVNNIASAPASEVTGSSRKMAELAERSQSVKFTGLGLQDTGANAVVVFPAEGRTVDCAARPAKRVCSEEKENAIEEPAPVRLSERPSPMVGPWSEPGISAQRKASAPGALGAGSVRGKPKIGLRRL